MQILLFTGKEYISQKLILNFCLNDMEGTRCLSASLLAVQSSFFSYQEDTRVDSEDDRVYRLACTQRGYIITKGGFSTIFRLYDEWNAFEGRRAYKWRIEREVVALWVWLWETAKEADLPTQLYECQSL